MKQDYSKLIGAKFVGREAYLVTASRIASFCASVGDNNPLYIDEAAAKAGPFGRIVAPPAFVASFRYADNVFDQLPAFGRSGLMGGIDIELDGVIAAGDEISVTSELKEVYEKTGRTGTMIFVVVRSTLTNQHGAVVARVDHRMMNRPA